MHYHKKKIYYHDTDCGGVVYYANYLKYLEEARTEFFAQRGSTIKDLADRGTLFVVGKVEISYRAAARYGDEIEVCTRVEKVRSASLVFYQEIKRTGVLLIECRTQLVCIDEKMSPRLMPAELKESFK